jgi:hypothetical protein
MPKSRRFKGGIPNIADIGQHMVMVKDRFFKKKYVPSEEDIRETETHLKGIRNKLEEVLPENEIKFNEYVNHEWNNCSKTVNGWIPGTTVTEKIHDIDDFKSKINTDRSYDTSKFTDEDYVRLHDRCSSANKEVFSNNLRETEEGQFILNPRTGGKRKKTRKNKRKSKTKKKGRK